MEVLYGMENKRPKIWILLRGPRPYILGAAMNIIKCMAEHATDKAKHIAKIDEDVLRAAITNVLEKDYAKLVSKYGEDVMGFFCIYMDWE